MEPFKLHAVLKYRKQIEDSAKQDYYSALEEEARAHEIFLAHQGELQNLYTTLQSDRDQGTTVDRLVMLENRISVVKESLITSEESLKKMREQLEVKRNALVKAGKERRIMEKMEEKQNQAYRQYLDKKERIMLDELAVIYRKK